MELKEELRIFDRLAECAGSIRGQRSLIEHVIQHGEQPEYLRRGTSTMWVLASPVPSADGVVNWTTVSPTVPEFRDVVTNRIRRGYLPLGMLDVRTPCAEVFAGAVPEAHRKDFIKFAKAQIQLVYLALTGKISPEYSWVEDGPFVVYESEKAELLSGTTPPHLLPDDGENPGKLN
jgi:hypothetical protein